MENIIIVCTVISYLSFMILFLFSRLIQQKNEKGLNRHEHYTFDSLSESFYSLCHGMCSLEYGKNWNCDPNKNIIHIPNKSQYSLFDKFVLMHETGHLMDSKEKHRGLYKFDFVLRIFHILSYFPIVLLLLILLKNITAQIKNVIVAICSVYTITLLAEICITVFIEASASRWALTHINAELHEKKLRISAHLAIFDQVLVKIMLVFPLILLIIVALGKA